MPGPHSLPYIFYFKLQIRKKNRNIMGSCYSADNIVEEHLHRDITCKSEEPEQKYGLGTVSNR